MKEIYNRDSIHRDLIPNTRKSWHPCESLNSKVQTETDGGFLNWTKTLLLSSIILLFSFASFATNNPKFDAKGESTKKANAATAVFTTCGNATVIAPSSLPIVNQALVCGTTNDVTSANSPACGSNSYKGGLESLYSFTPTTSGSYNIAINGQTWTGIFVYTGCPTSGGTCLANITSSGTSKNVNAVMTAGVQYYIMFDTYPTPDSPCPGTFSITPPPVAAAVPSCVASPTSPANNAINVVSKTFTWPVATGVPSGYKLYVGSDVSGTNLISGLDVGFVQTYTAASLTLAANTPYYWKVVPYNAFGDATSCTVWMFTSAPAPSCATGHVPADLATNIAKNPNLSWTAPSSPSASSYDLYFGTTSTPELIGNVTTTSAALSSLLEANTTYYWKVVPKNVSGDAVGCTVRSFTTGTNVVYCTVAPSTNGCSGDNISSVLLASLNDTGLTCTPQYEDRSTAQNAIPNLPQNLTMPMSVGVGAGGTEYVGVWVDFNKNGLFDATEFTSLGSGNNVTISGTISIPADALLGNTKMRVRSQYNTAFTGTGACSAVSYGSSRDYTVNIVAPPSCIPPSALTAVNVLFTSATLSWTSDGSNFDIEWGTAGFFQGEGTLATSATNTYALSGLTAETSYSYFVRNVCGGANGTSTWSGPYVFFTGYCVPTGTSNSYRINGFATTSGFTNISNLANGTTNPYNNYSAMSVTQAAAGEFNYTINVPGSTATKIWIDYNKNLIFEAGELVASNLTSPVGGVWNGTITLPSEIALGDYRMRVRSNYFTYTFDACGAGQFNYGEAEDYTLSVVSPPSCLPPASLSATNIGFTSADLSWTSDGTSFDVEYGPQGFTQGEGTQQSASSNSYALSDLASGTSYSFYVRNLCDGGDGNSLWSGPFSFSTFNKASVTWTQGFATTTLPAGWINPGFVLGTVTALSPGATTNYLYKNLWSNAVSANVQTIYVGELGANDRLKFNYKLANYDSPYAVPASDSGNFMVEIQQFPSETWMEVATVSNNGIEGWQEVSYSLADYAGEIVKIRITGNWVSGDYYLGLDNFTIEPTPCPEWTGAMSTSWSVAGNWCDNMVPAATADVINNSSNPMVISSDVTAASLTIGATANVTVNGSLTVGNITVAPGGVMTVSSDAAVLQTAVAVNSGMVTVNRNSTDLFRQDYTLWSSPVSGQKLRTFSPATLYNRFSSYDTALGTNGNYVQEIVTTSDVTTKMFGTAKGYLIRMPNNWVQWSLANTASPYLGSFTGTLNNGDVSIALSGANSKLNLVGNPYASPISIAALFAANTNIDETLYFWRKKGSVNSVASGYATYTSMGIASADATIDGTVPTNIETGQGFFVVANTVTPGNLVFNNTMRNNGAATFYKGATTTELHRFWLNLSDDTNVVGQTLIGYKSGATQDVDAGFDALYFNDSPTALTSLINNNEYIIQGRSVPFVDTDTVSLGFKSNVAGDYTISLANFDGLFAENQDIFLKDNLTGTVQNLKLANYTFATPVGVHNARFEVQYTNSTLGTDNPVLADHAILIGVKDQKIAINAGSVVMDKIELIDVAGRVIYTQDGVNATTAILENVVSANQMLIVRISTAANGVVNQKIIF